MLAGESCCCRSLLCELIQVCLLCCVQLLLQLGQEPSCIYRDINIDMPNGVVRHNWF